MSLSTFIVKFFELIAASTAMLPHDEAAPNGKPETDRDIRVTPARRPIWPTCCG